MIPNHLHRREASSWEVTSFLLGALLVLMATVPVVVSTVGRWVGIVLFTNKVWKQVLQIQRGHGLVGGQ